jgi:GNAT superfamily N-acetyltransferase
MTPPGYSFRCLAAAELPLFNDLYNACHGAGRPLEEARWLYGGNPNGEALVMAAFDQRGELAGVRPAIPWRLSWGGEERTAYEFADALVAPAHRNRGLFSHLVELICELAEREDFTLFSIPNQRSLPVYRRTPQLQVLGCSETRARPISWVRYLGSLAGLDGRDSPRVPAGAWDTPRAEGEVLLRPVERFDSDFEPVHAAFAGQAASFTLRRREFLQWRYFGSPLRRYRVALIEERGQVRGYLVIRLIGRVAHVIDLFVAPDAELARRALRLATAWATGVGAIALQFNSSQDNFFQRAAARCGFRLRKRSGSLVLDRNSVRRLAARRGGRLEPRDLYFVMGDFDFF